MAELVLELLGLLASRRVHHNKFCEDCNKVYGSTAPNLLCELASGCTWMTPRSLIQC